MQERGDKIPKSISPTPEAPPSSNGFQPDREASSSPQIVNPNQPSSAEQPSGQPRTEQNKGLQKEIQKLLEELSKPKTQEQKAAEVLFTIATTKPTQQEETIINNQRVTFIKTDWLALFSSAILQSERPIYFDENGNPEFHSLVFSKTTTSSSTDHDGEPLKIKLEGHEEPLQIAVINKFENGSFICTDINGQRKDIPRLTVLEALHRRFQEAAKQKGTPESQYKRKTKVLADKLMDSVRKTETAKATPKTQTQPENQQQDETTQIEPAEQPDQPEQPEEPEESITDGDIEAVIKENKEALAERDYLLIPTEKLKPLFEKLQDEVLKIEDPQKRQRYLTKLKEIFSTNPQAFFTKKEFREILSLGLELKREELIAQFHSLQGQQWVQEQLGDLADQIKKLRPERITALVEEATFYLFEKLDKDPNFFDKIKKDLEEGNIQRLINNLIASEDEDKQQLENLKKTGKTIGIGLLAILLMIIWKSKDEMKDGQQGMAAMLGH